MVLVFAAAFRKKSSKGKSSSDGTKQPRSKKSKTSSSQEEASCSVYESDTHSTYKSHTKGKKYIGKFTPHLQ